MNTQLFCLLLIHSTSWFYWQTFVCQRSRKKLDRIWILFNYFATLLTTLGDFSRNLPTHTDPEGSLPCSQKATLLRYYKSRDSSVGIALGYGLDDRGSRVRFPTGAGNFSLRRVQNGSGVHPASYPMGTRGCFLRDKVAGA
jgi:hypothetical protein